MTNDDKNRNKGELISEYQEVKKNLAHHEEQLSRYSQQINIISEKCRERRLRVSGGQLRFEMLSPSEHMGDNTLHWPSEGELVEVMTKIAELKDEAQSIKGRLAKLGIDTAVAGTDS